MATGACGINCDVCGLKVQGVCRGCNAGTAFTVEDVDQHPCDILKCAVRKNVAYCLKDCKDFPCALLEKGQYPFSAAYLGMHKQRMGT